ncbi:hypothetical protein SISNIDRAFT_493595 [Sistotremastrum niveocremeum HHB9708]|uniref:Extracellular membrane protein CFEM domain-containing protein n=1 Tax=Sistotremastrum niveocremeum HHB9708 TaxID=1314777 RepID=A0A164Y7Y8_9AGAM|nr:hypothetical protein SISNIDRAFT_493595 [Sistotremastrum niveocremeum HHB9708]
MHALTVFVILFALGLSTSHGGGTLAASLRRQDTSGDCDKCTTLSGPDGALATCKVLSCFCTTPYLEAERTCLQCTLDQEGPSNQASLQSAMDTFIDDCRRAGIQVPDEPLTISGGTIATSSSSSISGSSTSSASVATTSSASSTAESTTPVSTESTSSPSPTTSKSNASSERSSSFVGSIATFGILVSLYWA